MSKPTPTQEQLSAYVDGELSTAEASAVARAVSEDRSLAREVAVLSRLKALVEEGLEESGEDPVVLPAAAAESAREQPFSAVAATVALLLFLGGGAALHLAQGAISPPWLTAAWSAHDAWSDEDAAARPDAAPDSGTLLAKTVGFDPTPLVPDLSSAGLRLTSVEPMERAEGRRGLHFGYEGSRGCRLSLVLMAPFSGLSESLRAFDDDRRLAAGWRVGSLGHLVLAEGMDPGRFALIAASLRKAAFEAAPLRAETRTALAQSRAESQPCLS